MTEETPTSCANCGKAECAEIKLKTCSACKLVVYCDRDCQLKHRKHHENACKKRAAELYDGALFMEPPKADDCPLCFEMLPTLKMGREFRACCGKISCSGCFIEFVLQSNGSPSCPFCRADVPSSPKEYTKLLSNRVDADDAVAMYELGCRYFNGSDDHGVQKDTDKAIKLLERAAKLGSSEAYNQLGYMYYNGNNVVNDEKKAKQYYEKGAIAGCALSRYNLGCMEAADSRFDRATKHWLIAANWGVTMAVDRIREAVISGDATRDHYKQALEGYKEYLEAVRTDKREKAVALTDACKYLF